MRTIAHRRPIRVTPADRVAHLARPVLAAWPMAPSVGGIVGPHPSRWDGQCAMADHAGTDAENLTPAEIVDWARAYCIAVQGPLPRLGDRHPLWWSVERFLLFSAVGRVEDCWRAILEVLRVTEDDHVIDVLAAGPLQDLIEMAGAAFADRIEWEAWTDPAFCRLLNAAWECGAPEVWTRLHAVRTVAARMGSMPPPPGGVH